MAKLEAPYDDTKDLFNEKIAEADLSINITIITNNRLKEPYKVVKCSESEKFKTRDDVNIYINEVIFDQLPKDQQVILIEESLAWIVYDAEKDVVTIDKPDFSAHELVLDKYDYEVIKRLRASVKSLYTAAKEAEDASKAVTAKAR